MADLLDIREKLQDTSAAIVRLERAISLHPEALSLVGNLRSLNKRWTDLEADFHAAATKLEVEVCDYRILVEDQPSLMGISKLLLNFQNLFSTVYDAIKNGPKRRARLGVDVLNETSLGFAYTYPGSVGMVLTLSTEKRASDGPRLDHAIQSALSIVEASDSKVLAEQSNQLGVPSIRAAYYWASDQLRFHMGSDIKWRREGAVKAALFVQRHQLEEFCAIYETTSEEKEEVVNYVIELLGADSMNHTFHARLDDGSMVRGKCSPEVIGEKHAVELPRHYKGTFRKATKIWLWTDKREESLYLLGLQEL